MECNKPEDIVEVKADANAQCDSVRGIREEEAGILKDATVFQVPEKLIHPSCFSSSYWLL